MKTQPKSKTILSSIFSSAFLLSSIGQATMNPSAPRGEKIVSHTVAGKKAEMCVIPRHFEGADFSADDRSDEQKLCGLNAYVNTAICGKTASTNPGIEFYSIPDGMSRAQVIAGGCDLPTNKKLAKYKLSTSCSYAPSILGYYHLSRILGDVANVPVAVVRTFDLQSHKAIARQTLNSIKDRTSLIWQTWASLNDVLVTGRGHKRADNIFTSDYDQSYGALQENPRGEEKYSEFFNKAPAGISRAAAFGANNPIYKTLKRTERIERIIGTSFTPENVEKFIQLRDAAEMIVLDTILSQQDRFGNVHFVKKYVYLDNQTQDVNGNPKAESKKKLTPAEIASFRAVQVREMMLKDNDCGVTKTNAAADAKLLSGVAHMRPDTYQRLQQLAAAIDSNEVKNYFMSEALFTESDYSKVLRPNLKSVALQLKNACRAGKLQLDLDLAAHFSGRPVNVSCD